MNLHEKCLLNYLKHPDELEYTTEILKLNNRIMEEKFVLRNILANMTLFNYTNSVK